MQTALAGDFNQYAMFGAEKAEPHWYAAHTCARHEQSVAQQLRQKQIDHFLPVYQSVHRWKDRRKVISEPLFAGYVFVHISLNDRHEVLRIGSVVRLVGFGGIPAPLPDPEVEALRRGIVGTVLVEPHPFLKVGQRVRIIAGPMAGSDGILVRRRSECRVVLSLDLIMRSVAVEVAEADIAPLR